MTDALTQLQSLLRARELMNYCIENADQISAIALDSDENLMAIGLSMLLAGSSMSGEELAESVRLHTLLAFHLGYEVGKQEGDLSIWTECG